MPPSEVVTDPVSGLQITVKGDRGDKGDDGPLGGQGPAGPRGSTGPQGPVRYGGFVAADGQIEHLQGTPRPRVSSGGAGIYCIQMDSDGQPHAVNATLVLPEGGFTPPRWQPPSSWASRWAALLAQPGAS